MRTVKLRGGFSIIELMVVTAIIAVLVSLLVGVTRITTTRAKVTKCASHLRQIGAAFEVYASENRGYVPRSNNFQILGANNLAHPSWPNWLVAVSRVTRGHALDAWADVRMTPILFCPADVDAVNPSSYILNAFAIETAPSWRGSPPTAYSSTRRRSDVPWVLEARERYIDDIIGVGSALTEHTRTLEDPSHLTKRVSWKRHGTGCNILYADSSVRYFNDLPLPVISFDDGIRNRKW